MATCLVCKLFSYLDSAARTCCVCMQYDKNRSGALEFEELHAVLADLGIMV